MPTSKHRTRSKRLTRAAIGRKIVFLSYLARINALTMPRARTGGAIRAFRHIADEAKALAAVVWR